MRIGKEATAMAHLAKRVWDKTLQTFNTKMKVYQACVLSTLLYGSESGTDSNASVLSQAGMLSMFAILNQTCQCLLGHVNRMEDGHIPKDILHSELASRTQPTGRPTLCYKDTCKRDLKTFGI